MQRTLWLAPLFLIQGDLNRFAQRRLLGEVRSVPTNWTAKAQIAGAGLRLEPVKQYRHRPLVTLAFYEDLLSRGRAFVREAWAKVSDADMNKEITRERPDGSQRLLSIRWAMYHVLEHYAGHRGQVQLLRHMYRATVGAPSK